MEKIYSTIRPGNAPVLANIVISKDNVVPVYFNPFFNTSDEQLQDAIELDVDYGKDFILAGGEINNNTQTEEPESSTQNDSNPNASAPANLAQEVTGSTKPEGSADGTATDGGDKAPASTDANSAPADGSTSAPVENNNAISTTVSESADLENKEDVNQKTDNIQ